MKAVLIFIVCIFYLQTSFGQNEDAAKQSFQAILQNNLSSASLKPPESFHIITDRPWYLAGEEIWFKVYITTSGLPATGSAVLYLSFADSSGRILVKKILPVDDNGVSYGNIKLPLDLKRGWYSLGVQTEWNRNFNNGFEKLVYVNEKGMIPEKISFSSALFQKVNNVGFFPEGGSFVAGLQNHFGVEAIGKNLEPVAVKGFVIDTGNKDTLAVFETSANGLGEFTLPAVSRNTLSAIVYWPDGNKTLHQLPEMKPEGMILQTSVSSDRLSYNIESTRGFISQTAEVMLVAIMHDEIVFSKLFKNAGDLISFADYIPLNQFPNGIISLCLYTMDGKQIAQREVYHFGGNNFLVEKKEISFEPKAKNEIEITLPDTLGGTYSVNITDADLTDELIDEAAKEKTINSRDPFSLAERSNNKVKEINLYLLTDGEKTISDNSNDGSHSYRFAYQQALNISGKFYYPRNGNPVSGKTVNFFPKNSASGNFLLSDSLDENGNFKLRDLYIIDSSVMCWNINGLSNNELEKVKSKLNGNWFDSMTTRSTVFQKKNIRDNNEKNAKLIPEALKNYYAIDSLEKKKTKTLPEVTIFAKQRKRIEELDKTYAGTSLFGGRLGEAFVFDMEEEKTYYPDIFSFLRSRVPELKISGPPYNPILIYRSGDMFTGGPNVVVFVNENPISESTDIASIQVSEIAYVKVFKAPFSYILVPSGTPPTSAISYTSTQINNGKMPQRSSGSSGGIRVAKIDLAIAIYLKKTESKFVPAFIPPTFQSFSVKGFSLPDNFPLPDYPENKEMENVPDKRMTLYWNPEVNFVNGKAKIVFYNNDFSKRYLIKVEGINELGEVISYREIIDK